MIEGTAATGDRKVVAAVYFLRLRVHRSGGSEIATITVSKQASGHLTVSLLLRKSSKRVSPVGHA